MRMPTRSMRRIEGRLRASVMPMTARGAAFEDELYHRTDRCRGHATPLGRTSEREADLGAGGVDAEEHADVPDQPLRSRLRDADLDPVAWVWKRGHAHFDQKFPGLLIRGRQPALIAPQFLVVTAGLEVVEISWRQPPEYEAEAGSWQDFGAAHQRFYPRHPRAVKDRSVRVPASERPDSSGRQ